MRERSKIFNLFGFVTGCICILLYIPLSAQNFVNSDLDGPTITTTSVLPFNWTQVSNTDVVSMASGNSQATSDLTSVNQPNLGAGIMGIPYSGNTFVSGLQLKNGLSSFFHEGIKQTVTGLDVNKGYVIIFQQTVVKQSNCVDTSGSWAVYSGSNLLGVSEISKSNLEYDDINLNWEERCISFVPPSSFNIFKFLPMDDDTFHQSSYIDKNGGLRMGIDSIYIVPCSLYNIEVDLGEDTFICNNELMLDAEHCSSTYLWSNDSTTSGIMVNEPGQYWVEVYHVCDTVRDTIEVIQEAVPTLDFGADTLLCDGSLILDAYDSIVLSYEWQDGSTSTTYEVDDEGLYWVELLYSCGTYIDSIFVSTYTEGNLNLGADTTLCAGEDLLLEVTNVQDVLSYLWQDNSTMSSFLVTSVGNYFVNVETPCGILRDSIYVEYDSPFSIDLGNDTQICQGTQVLLEAFDPNVSSYFWQDGSNDENYIVNEEGLYWVELQNACGMMRDSILVWIYPESNLFLGEDTTLCPTEELTLNAQVNDAISYLWYNNTTMSSLSVTEPGTYFVEVNTTCKILQDTIVVSYMDSISIDLGEDTVICNGETVSLNAFFPNATYLWQDGVNTATREINQPGVYDVIVTVDNCSMVDAIQIDLFPIQNLNLGENVVVCIGEEQFLIESNLIGDYYLWNTGSTSSSIYVSSSGYYSLELVDENGCLYRDTIYVGFTEPSLDLVEEVEICLGETVLLNASRSHFVEYYWNTGANNAQISLNEPGIYSVLAIDSNFCTEYDSVIVELGGCNIFVPNTFTPNGDLVNDVFMAQGENIEHFEMNIFNRYGEEVFSSISMEKGWDGTFKGKLAPMGVYSYKILFQNTVSKDIISKNGVCSLIR